MVRDKNSYLGKVVFVAKGELLKKDGTPGVNTAEHYAAP